MIPKPNKDRKFPPNYRPISLLPAISKIAERIVLCTMQEEVEERELLPKEQFGFRGRHSAEEQVLRITEIAMERFERRKTTGLLLFYIERAFDRTGHDDGLIYMLYVKEMQNELSEQANAHQNHSSTNLYLRIRMPVRQRKRTSTR